MHESDLQEALHQHFEILGICVGGTGPRVE